MWKEFREFAIKGNVLDLAVGVIIGGAFTKIVDSLVKDIIMPPLGVILGKIDFSNRYLLFGGAGDVGANGKRLSLEEAQKLGPTLAYGQFINNVFSFLLVAFAVFLIVKAINRLRRQLETELALGLAAAPPALVKEDSAATQVAQNAQIIALLEKIAAK